MVKNKKNLQTGFGEKCFYAEILKIVKKSSKPGIEPGPSGYESTCLTTRPFQLYINVLVLTMITNNLPPAA